MRALLTRARFCFGIKLTFCAHQDLRGKRAPDRLRSNSPNRGSLSIIPQSFTLLSININISCQRSNFQHIVNTARALGIYCVQLFTYEKIIRQYPSPLITQPSESSQEYPVTAPQVSISLNPLLTSKILHFHGPNPFVSPFKHESLYQSLNSLFLLHFRNASFKSSHPCALAQSSAHGCLSPPKQNSVTPSSAPTRSAP